MIIYRVKQFIWAFTSIFKEIDKEYISRYLNDEEKLLFNKLKKSDKAHSIRVSKENLNLLERDFNKGNLSEEDLAKVGLLHDIGKIDRPLNIFEKSIIVILDKITKGKLKKYNNIKLIGIYYNHSKRGVEILKNYNNNIYSYEFLEAIEYHHMKNININNKILVILRESDNKN